MKSARILGWDSSSSSPDRVSEALGVMDQRVTEVWGYVFPGLVAVDDNKWWERG